jgi:phosphotransferase system HPr-like phosphotransfer protein
MQSKWQSIRVFVSSTFRDMSAERDMLVKVAFPALRERLAPYCIELEDIDLRWGITDEQAESGKTIDLCLHAIEYSRPFFICLLGEVYGSILPRYASSSAKFNWLEHFPDNSMTELEILYGALLDNKNAAYAFFYFRDAKVLDQIPQPIRDSQYIDNNPILRRKLRNLKEKIRNSQCRINDGYSATWNPDKKDSYSLKKGAIDGLSLLAERVVEDLFESIKKTMCLPDVPLETTITDKCEHETLKHLRFADANSTRVIEREEIQSKLVSYIFGNECHPLILIGNSGIGKTTAMSALLRYCKSNFPEYIVVPHFVGATALSFRLSNALGRFCEAIKSVADLKIDIPSKTKQCCEMFKNIIGSIPTGKKLVLLLDGIDEIQETDKAYELGWLPDILPSNVRIICASKLFNALSNEIRFPNGSVITVVSDARYPSPVNCDVKPYAERRNYPIYYLSPLTQSESLDLIDNTLNLLARSLDAKQKEALLLLRMSNNPLFLSTALDELRLFGSHTNLTKFIAGLPNIKIDIENKPGFYDFAIQPIFEVLIRRLQDEYPLDGYDRILKFLALTMSGLSESELCTLAGESISKSEVAALLRQLRPYLYSRDGLYVIRYKPLREAILNPKWRFIEAASLPPCTQEFEENWVSFLIADEKRLDLKPHQMPDDLDEETFHSELATFFRSLPLSERKAIDFYYHFFSNIKHEKDYYEKINVLFSDLDLFRLAWELDREKLLDYYRASQGGEGNFTYDSNKIFEIGDATEKTLAQLEDLAHVELAKGNQEEAVRLCRRSEAVADITTSSERLSVARSNLMVLYGKMGKIEMMNSVYADLRQDCISSKSDKSNYEFIRPLVTIAYCCIEQGNIEGACKFGFELLNSIETPSMLDALRKMSEKNDNVKKLAYQLGKIGLKLGNDEDYKNAQMLFQLQSILGEVCGNMQSAALAARNAGATTLMWGHHPESIPFLRKSLELYRKYGNIEEDALQSLQYLAEASHLTGRPDLSLGMICECVEECTHSDDKASWKRMQAVLNCIDIALADVTIENLEKNQNTLVAIESILRSYSRGIFLPIFILMQAAYANKAGDIDATLRKYEQARAFCEVEHIYMLQQVAACRKARLLKRIGREEEAVAHYREVLKFPRTEDEEDVIKEAREAIDEYDRKNDTVMLISGEEIVIFKPGVPYDFLVSHPAGLVAENCILISKATVPLRGSVAVQCRGMRADGKSIMSLLMLAASTGSILEFVFSVDTASNDLKIPEKVGIFLPTNCTTTFQCCGCGEISPILASKYGSTQNCPRCQRPNRPCIIKMQYTNQM